MGIDDELVRIGTPSGMFVFNARLFRPAAGPMVTGGITTMAILPFMLLTLRLSFAVALNLSSFRFRKSA